MKWVFRVSQQLVSKTLFIPSRTERYMMKNVYGSSCKVSLYFVRFSWNLYFLDGF